MTALYSRFFAAVVFLSTFLSTLCAAQSSLPVAMDASREARLEKDIPVLMDQAGIPGLSIAVIRGGKTVWTGAFGVRDESAKLPVDHDTVFNVASLTKPVFTYAVLKLVEAGKLKLDEPLAPYLPKDMIAGDPRFQQVTARFILSHRAGFPNGVRKGQAITIHFTPGEKFSYSGTGMGVLQQAIEKITGIPLDQFIQQSVFKPLGMKHSYMVWNPTVKDDSAIGYTVGGDPRPYKTDEAFAAGSLVTTAEDYATFLNAILRRKGLKASSFREMETSEIAVDTGCANCVDGTPTGKLSTSIFWGLGVGIEKTSDGLSLWHWGDNETYKAFFVVRPESRSGVVYMTNGENGLAIGSAILAATLGGSQPAFDWLKYDNYDSPGLVFTKIALQQGASTALAQFSKELAAGSVPEGTLNQVGYALMGSKKIEDAILVFEKNVELHPASWNAYDSLGEAYMNKGENELAVKNYRKSIELNPSNDNGRAMLKKLGGE